MTENDLQTLIAFSRLRVKLRRCPRVRELATVLKVSGTSAHGRLQRLVEHGMLKRGSADMTGTYAITEDGKARLAEDGKCPTCGSKPR